MQKAELLRAKMSYLMRLAAQLTEKGERDHAPEGGRHRHGPDMTSDHAVSGPHEGAPQRQKPRRSWRAGILVPAAANYQPCEAALTQCASPCHNGLAPRVGQTVRSATAVPRRALQPVGEADLSMGRRSPRRLPICSTPGGPAAVATSLVRQAQGPGNPQQPPRVK